MSVAQNKAARRVRLIEVAIEDILENGVEGCSFRTLAKRSGTTTAPFTYEFGSRANMLKAIADRTWAWLEPDDVGTARTPLELLKSKSRRWTPIDKADVPFVNVYIQLTFHGIRHKDLADHMDALNAKGDALWHRLVEMAQAQGEIPASIGASDLVVQLWTMSDGLAVARMSHPTEFTAETVERLWSDAFDRIVGA